MIDAYAYLDPATIEDDLDRMEQVRSEWEPGVLELMSEGYPDPSLVIAEKALAVSDPFRGRGV